jgi:hypothetical protein
MTRRAFKERLKSKISRDDEEIKIKAILGEIN